MLKDHDLRLEGYFGIACFDEDDGLLWLDSIENDVVAAALTDLLSVYFAGGSASGSWAIGLIDGSSSPVLASTDTMGSHAGWSEFTGYSQSARGTWTPTVANGIASNSSQIPFSFNANGTIAGLFVTSNATKGGTSGTLWSTALLSLSRAVAPGQSLRFTYTLRAVGGG